MRVAFVTFAFPEFSASVIRGLLGEDIELSVHVPAPLAQSIASDIEATADIRPFDGPRLRRPVSQWRACSSLVRQLEESKPDVIHLQQGHLWFNWFLDRLSFSRLVLTVHDAVHHPGDKESKLTPHRVLRRGFLRADRLLTQSNSIKQQLVASGLSASRIDVIPHPALDSPVRLVAEPEKPPIVLFFGRIWPYKGLDVLLRAAPLVEARVPDVKFIIAGRGEDMRRYEQLMRKVRQLELINRHVSTEERWRLFERSAVIALPYVEASQSGVVPVAFAHGRPVVATRVGGLPESVAPGTGLLVEPGDHVGLAEALSGLLLDPPLAKRLGLAGRELVETKLSAEAIASQTVASYRRAMSQG